MSRTHGKNMESIRVHFKAQLNKKENWGKNSKALKVKSNELKMLRVIRENNHFEVFYVLVKFCVDRTSGRGKKWALKRAGLVENKNK